MGFTKAKKEMIQSTLFHNQEVQKLIDGKETCEVCPNCGAHTGCGRKKRAYAKTMDRRLVAIMLRVADYCDKRKIMRFDIREIFGDSQTENADFRKLHYWGLVEETGKVRWYQMTRKGWAFTLGNVRLPKVVHVWKDAVIASSEAQVAIFEAEPRWQQMKSDYTLDYLPWPFVQQPAVKTM